MLTSFTIPAILLYFGNETFHYASSCSLTLLTEVVFTEVQDGQSYSAGWKTNVYEVRNSVTPFLKHLYKLT